MITLSRNPRTFTSASSWQLKSLNRAYNCALNLNPHILYPSPSFLNAIQTSWWPAAEPLSPFWSNFLKMPSHTSCPPLCSLSTCTSVSSGSSMGLFLLKMYASVANEVAIVGGRGGGRRGEPLRGPPKLAVSLAQSLSKTHPPVSFAHTHTHMHLLLQGYHITYPLGYTAVQAWMFSW